MKKIYIIFRLYKPLESTLKEKKWNHTGSPAYFNFIKYIQKNKFFDPHVYLILDKNSSSLYESFEIEISGINNKVKVLKYYNFTPKNKFLKIELLLNRVIQYLKIYFNTDREQIYYLDRDNILLYHFLKFKNGNICFRLLGITKNLFTKLFGDMENELFSRPLKNEKSLIICTNDGSWSKETMGKITNPNFHVLSNGCDFEFKNYNDLKNPIQFLCVSRIENGKGIDKLLNLMSNLKKRGFNNFTLQIVGGGSLLNNMIELSNELELNQNCIFLGEKPHSLIIKYLQKTNMFFSLNNFGYMGNNVIEALSQGVPSIINSTNLNIPQEIKKHFLVIDTNEIDRSCSIILDFFSSNENFINLQKTSKIFFNSNFKSWESRINYEIDLINKFIKN